MSLRPEGSSSRAFFAALVEHSSDGIALLDPNGRIRFASHAAQRILGYPIDVQLEITIFEFVHPDDVARARLQLGRCLERPGEALTGQYRVRHSSGEWRVIEVVAVNRLDDPNVAAVVANYRDVTDRLQEAERLRATEERLARLVESARDLIYYCDPMGCFTYVNPTACEVTGYSEAELIGRHYLSLISAGYREIAGAHYLTQLQQRIPSTYFEFPFLTKAGQTLWVGQHVQLVYDDGHLTAFQAIARDVSRQRDAEERLRDSEHRYRSLIHGAAFAIYRTTVDGRILDCNPALVHMLGYDSVEQLTAVNLGDVYRDPSLRMRLVEEYLHGPQPVIPAEVEWRRRDGTLITVRIAPRVVDAGNGKVYFEGIAEDITERHALEVQLREAQKMDAVGRLARGIAHDFNNILAAVVGCSDLILGRHAEDDPTWADALEINKSAHRGASLTRQLLAFSRRQPMPPKPLDLNDAVAASEDMLRRLCGNAVTLTVRRATHPVVIVADPGQVEQVVLNLVVNARDAMPDGGSVDITVDVQSIATDHARQYPGVTPGEYARLTVADTGAGMSPDVQRHVFEPFFSTKDASKGTGLGLSIVYGIARDAGGTVRLTSEPHKGTTFEVLLPTAPPTNAPKP